MKKIYLSAILACITITATAQREGFATPVTGKVRSFDSNNQRVNRDTLYYPQLLDGTWSPTIYGVTGGGYILGTNTYGDLQKTQTFIAGDLHPATDHIVEGAVIWFGGKEMGSGNPASKVVVKVYAMDGTGEDLSGVVNLAPGTVLASVDLLISDIDTAGGNFTNVSFPTPVTIGAGTDYALGIDFSTLATGDSAGVVSSLDGEYVVPETVWEQWSDGSWYTLPAAGWGSGTFDVVMAIFAAVDLDVSSINEESAIQMVQVYPNPASENVKFLFNTEVAGKMTLEIRDVTGKLIDVADIGNQSAGKGTFTYDLNNLTGGLYFYTIRNGANHITGRITVTK